MKKLISLALVVLASHANASVYMSVEYPISLQTLKSLQTNLEKAKNRSQQQMEEGYLAAIFDENDAISPLVLVCTKHQPDRNGQGCTVMISTKSAQEAGSVNISFEKEVQESVLKSTIDQVDTLLKTDANNVQDWNHKQFRNPLQNSTSEATIYYCASEGQTPNKFWSCSLFVSEKMN